MKFVLILPFYAGIYLQDKKGAGSNSCTKRGGTDQKSDQQKGEARIIVATGSSQFEMLYELIKTKVDWTKVTAFHLDEYIGIPVTHPASFRKYLKETICGSCKSEGISLHRW